MKKILYLFLLGLFVACNNEAQPIDYGNDNCSFCEMTIVSQAYAAQAVTNKGKQYKYDAIECLVKDQLQHNHEMEIQLVSDFENPGTMLKVDNAGFVINDSIKSPMGENLAAFKKESAVVNNASEGIFTWDELMTYFHQQDSLTTSRK